MGRGIGIPLWSIVRRAGESGAAIIDRHRQRRDSLTPEFRENFLDRERSLDAKNLIKNLSKFRSTANHSHTRPSRPSTANRLLTNL